MTLGLRGTQATIALKLYYRYELALKTFADTTDFKDMCHIQQSGAGSNLNKHHSEISDGGLHADMPYIHLHSAEKGISFLWSSDDRLRGLQGLEGWKLKDLDGLGMEY